MFVSIKIDLDKTLSMRKTTQNMVLNQQHYFSKDLSMRAKRAYQIVFPLSSSLLFKFLPLRKKCSTDWSLSRWVSCVRAPMKRNRSTWFIIMLFPFRLENWRTNSQRPRNCIIHPVAMITKWQGRGGWTVSWVVTPTFPWGEHKTPVQQDRLDITRRPWKNSYKNIEKVLTNYKFSADRIYNFDESVISTVLNTPKYSRKTKKR